MRTASTDTMKVFVALMIFLVSQLMENSQAALPNVGVCTFKELTNMERSCTTTFFQSLKKHPQGDCSTKFTTLLECFVTAILKCRTALSKSQARNALVQANINEKRYCEDAGMQDPALNPNKNRIPCSSTYFQKAYGCGNETLQLFRSNKGDTRLCSAYAEAIKCEKSLIRAECWYTGVQKELIDLAYDGYNPFCEPSTPTRVTPTRVNINSKSAPTEKNAVQRLLTTNGVVAFLTWAAVITSVPSW